MAEIRFDPDKACELLETETVSDRSRRWRRFRPQNFQTVVGVFEPRKWNHEQRTAEPQRWKAMCLVCGQRFQGDCMTGAVRTHICRFGAVHAHRDPLQPKERREG